MPPKKPPAVEAELSSNTNQESSELPPSNTTSTPPSNNASGPTSSASRGRGRGGKLVSQPKFSTRRSAAARQEAEQAAAEKKRSEQQARDAEKAKSRRFERKDNNERGGGSGRGGGEGGVGGASFRGGRGRGGYVGASDRNQSDGIASGPFSAGQADRKGLFRSAQTASGSSSRGGGYGTGGPSRGGSSASSNTVSGPFGGGHRPSESQSRSTAAPSTGRYPKRESGAGPSKPLDSDGDVSMDVKPVIRTAEDGGYISSDEDEEGAGMGRVNVEDLAYIDLTKDDGADYDHFAPVRITRVAHKERAVGINADGATNQAGEVAVEANDMAALNALEKKPPKQRVRGSDAAAERQRFMSVYDEDSDHDVAGATTKADIAAQEVQASTTEPPQIPQDPPSSPERNRKLKDKIKSDISSTMPEQPDHQTQEEADEWKRHQRDLEILRSELGIPAAAASPLDDNNNGDTNMTGTEISETTTDKRENKVYLFQFPPVLPDLAPLRIKPDPDNPDASAEAPTADAIAIDGPNNSADDPVAVSDDISPAQPHFPSGHVGKLRIHASGRATLDWGGTSLQLGMGTEASFLQDILVLEMPDTKSEVKDQEAVNSSEQQQQREKGVAMSMGQVKGKFVVTPDWDAIFSG